VVNFINLIQRISKMKKAIILILLMLTSSCAWMNPKGSMLDNREEISAAHLKPLSVCANQIKIEYDGFPNEVYNLANDWLEEVLKLNKDCENLVIFKINSAYIVRKHVGGITTYKDYIDAELTMHYMTGKTATAKAKTENLIKMDSDLTLAQKENYKRSLHEQTMNSFDKTMRESIRKWIK